MILLPPYASAGELAVLAVARRGAAWHGMVWSQGGLFSLVPWSLGVSRGVHGGTRGAERERERKKRDAGGMRTVTMLAMKRRLASTLRVPVHVWCLVLSPSTNLRFRSGGSNGLAYLWQQRGEKECRSRLNTPRRVACLRLMSRFCPSAAGSFDLGPSPPLPRLFFSVCVSGLADCSFGAVACFHNPCPISALENRYTRHCYQVWYAAHRGTHRPAGFDLHGARLACHSRV